MNVLKHLILYNPKSLLYSELHISEYICFIRKKTLTNKAEYTFLY